MSKNRITAYLMLFAVAAIWGAALPVIKFTLRDFPPLLFLTYRFFISCLILLPIFAIFDDRIPKFRSREMLMSVLAGFTGTTLNLGLLFLGIAKTTSIAAILIAATSPVFVVLAGHFFLKEKVSRQEMLGLVTAFLGAILITLGPSFEHDGQSVTGNALVFASIFAWVIYVIITKKELGSKISPLFLTTTSFLVGFITLLPVAILKYGSLAGIVSTIADAPREAHLGVLYMAVISGALAYWLYQEGQKRIEAGEATIFGYLQPIFTAPLAFLWLGEKVTPLFVVGAGVIILGVTLAEWKRRRQKKNP